MDNLVSTFKAIVQKRTREGIRAWLVARGYHQKPSFLIVGAQKAGTTSLFSKLSQHPELCRPQKKELRYFNNDYLYGLRKHFYYHVNLPLPYQTQGRRTFEATPEYLYHPECAKRIFEYDKSIRIIILLRNPVDRAYSAWAMYHHFSASRNHFRLVDSRGFEAAIRNELENIGAVNWYRDPFGYIRRGVYHDQVRGYLEVFPNEQIMVLESEELRSSTHETMRKILGFLNINEKALGRITNDVDTNVRDYDYKMNPEIRKVLQQFYEPFNEKLYGLIDKNFNWQ